MCIRDRDNTAFCFSLSQAAESKLRTPLPARSCALGSGDMMNSTARWSLKRLAYAAIINCSAQEYDDKRRRRPLQKIGRGCQNNTTLSVEYSREGSKADGANPSEAVLEIWAGNVPVREHQALAARACNGPFRKHQASAVLSCNVPVRERQGSAVRACDVPVRSTRPRDHDARPDPRSLAPCPRRSMAKNRQKLLLTAPEGAGGF